MVASIIYSWEQGILSECNESIVYTFSNRQLRHRSRVDNIVVL